jgi:hypothetical protein
MTLRSALVAVSLLGAVASGCSAEQWGFPRVPVSAVSPDGRFVAFVRNHPNLDPYDQSLWLQARGSGAVRVGRVPPDAWSCDRIVWSADSRRVAFVIAEAIVQVFDARTGARVFSGFVGRRSWDTPPRFVLRDVSLSHDGARVTFRECEKTWRRVDPARQNRRGTRVEPIVSGCADVPVAVTLESVPGRNHW